MGTFVHTLRRPYWAALVLALASGCAAQFSNPDPTTGTSGGSLPGLNFESSEVDLGATLEGKFIQKSLTLKNTDSIAITVPNISLGDVGSVPAYRVASTDCPVGAALNPNSSCKIGIEFGSQTRGSYATDLVFTYQSDGQSKQAKTKLKGKVVGPTYLELQSSATLDFSSRAVGSTTELSYTVLNAGEIEAQLGTWTDSALGLSSPWAVASGGTCSAASTLLPGKSCVLRITYSPSAAGSHSVTLGLPYNDGAKQTTVAAELRGTALAPGVISFSPAPEVNFGTVVAGLSRTQTVTLTNSGGFPLTVKSLAMTGANTSNYDIVTGTCAPGVLLSAGNSCTFTLRVQPLSAGNADSNLRVVYDDTISSTRVAEETVKTSAAAVPVLTLSDGPSYNFGTVGVGSYVEKTFTLTHSGGADATLNAISSAALNLGATGPFTLESGGNCVSSLPLIAGQTCTLVVRYTAAAAVTTTKLLTVSFSDGASNRISTRSISGTGSTGSSITISDGATYTFPNTVVGNSATKDFTLTNSGGITATYPALTSGALGLASPFSVVAGGTCNLAGSTLVASASCTLRIQYTPSASGSHSDSIDLSYTDAGGSRNTSRALQATAADPAQLALSDGPGNYSYGSVTVGANSTHTFTVTNTGGSAASLNAYANAAGLGLSAEFSLTGASTCVSAGSLNAGSSCNLVVQWAPSGPGAMSDSIDLGYNDGVGAQTASRGVTGTGITPASLALSDGPTYNFGNVPTGASPLYTFTVTNSGGSSATLGTVSSVGLGLASPFSQTGGTCLTGGTLAGGGATCTLIVQYAPAGTGAHSDSIDLAYNDGAAAQTASRALSGTGVNPATLALSDGPGSYSFGSVAVASSNVKTFTVTNSGGYSATLGTVSGVGLGITTPYSLSGGSCTTGASLAGGGGTCTIEITYSPGSTGTANDSIDLSYNDGVSAQTASRGVTGTATGPAVLTLSDGPGSYDYGSRAIASNNDHTFTVTNSGGFNATLGTVSTAGLGLAAPYSLNGGTCSTGATVAPAATCTVIIRYTPSGLGAGSDSIDLAYNDGSSAQTSSRGVTGTGVSAATLVISDGATYNYGSVVNGGTSDKIFTVTNTGGYTATLGTVSDAGLGLAAPYSWVAGDCATSLTLAPLATCTLTIRFSPLALGVLSDSIDLTYDDGATSTSSSRSLTGTGATAASLAFSDGPTYDYGTIAQGGTTYKTFTVTNSGGVPATLGTLSDAQLSLAAPFSYAAGGTCSSGGTLAGSGGTCTLVVGFNPSASTSYNDTVVLNYNDGLVAQTASRAVQGSAAVSGFILISNGPGYDFGSVALGATPTHTFTLTNTGGISATLGTVATSGNLGLAAPYTRTGGTCADSQVLANSATCTIEVTFTPGSSATFNDSLDVSYNDGLGATSSSRSITGVGGTAAVLSISNGATFDYGTKAVGSTTQQVFSVTNTGGVPGVIGTLTLPGAPFAQNGGTCSNGQSLAAAGSCTIIIDYSPAGTGLHSGTITVPYNDGLGAQSATRPIQGTGANPASLALSDGPTYDYTTVATGGYAEKTFTLSNSGGVSATLGTLDTSGLALAAPYSLVAGGTCSSAGSLAAAATCTLFVRFSPTANGVANDQIDVSYNNGVSAQTASRAVTGTGAAPAALALSDGPTFDFGTQATGSTAVKTFTVTNTGGVAGTLGTVSTAGLSLAAPFTFSAGGTCSTSGTVAAAASCTLAVQYAPVANGLLSDTIALSYNDGASAQSATRVIQGTGAAPASLSISDGATYNYGTLAQGATATKTFTVTNTGGISGTLGTVSTAGLALAVPYSLNGSTTCSTSGAIASAGSCLIVIDFAPGSAATFNDQIDLAYNDGASAQTASRAITGVGAAPASLSISDAATYNYGTLAQGATATKTFTVTNSGGYNATLGTVTAVGLGLASPYSVTGGTCSTGGTVTAGGGTCTIDVRFAPASAATFNDQIDLAYNDGASAQTASRAITGVGAAPASLSISDAATYNYGTLAQGATATKTFTVTNSGGVGATLGTINTAALALAAPYTLTGGSCTTGATVAAGGGTCTLDVQYSPSSIATHSDQMDVSYNDGAGAQTASRAITGTAVAPAAITISDGATYDFGTVTVGATSPVKTFTITNSGTYTATLGTISTAGLSLAAPYSLTGGTCASSGTLSAAATCTLVVTYTPAGAATHNDSIDVSFNDGVGSTSSSRAITGQGVTPASLSLSSTTVSYGSGKTGFIADTTITVTNSGGTGATSVWADIFDSYGNGQFIEFVSNTCGTTGSRISIGAGLTCAVTVRAVGPYWGTDYINDLNIEYHNGLSTQTSTAYFDADTYSGTQFSDSAAGSYNFGNVATGATQTTTVTFTNTSASTINNAYLNSAFSAGMTLVGTTCGTSGSKVSIAASGTCTATVQASSATAANPSGYLNIVFGVSGFSQDVYDRSVSIWAAIIDPYILTVSDGPTYDYGSVTAGSTAVKTFTLSNSGAGIITGLSDGTTWGNSYYWTGGSQPGTGGTCNLSSGTLAGGSTCTVTVSFTSSNAPVSGVAGTYTRTLQFNYNNGVASTNATRGVTATVVAGAASQLGYYSGSNSGLPVASTLPAPYQVRVLDAYGNPVSGVSVSWAVTAAQGNGAITSSTTTTDAAGLAEMTYRAGIIPGQNTLTATSTGLTGSPHNVTIQGMQGSWALGTTTSAPAARTRTNSVWTGSKLLVWGGYTGAVALDDGAIYDPVADSWSNMAASGISARVDHSAVWTGTHLVVWGGGPNTGCTAYNTGGIYDPVANSWTTTSTTGAPAAVTNPGAVWTGSKMIVFGGMNGTCNPTAQLGIFDPGANSWSTPAPTNAPSARYTFTATWTGREMIVWGGYDTAYTNTGAVYSPESNTWTAMSTASAPAGRYGHSAVWTGKQLIVWGGYDGSSYLKTGGLYNPITNSWSGMTTPSYIVGRYQHNAFWLGSSMAVVGGYSVTDCGHVRLYDPINNSWGNDNNGGYCHPDLASAPGSGRYEMVGAWTGSKMLLFGGLSGGGVAQNSLHVWNPQWQRKDSWTSLATGMANAPSARYSHSMVWTGSQVLVWGGYSSAGAQLGDGSAYDPISNSWTTMGTGGSVPVARGSHRSVWTGKYMIVWGGDDGMSPIAYTGSYYNPSTGNWTKMYDQDDGSPSPNGRWSHAAVWTGSKFMTWGGWAGAHVKDGWLYDIETDSWTQTTSSALDGRQFPLGVWTGKYFLMWGGVTDGAVILSDGALYNPATDSWTTMTNTGAPSARWGSSFAWTGSKLVVWGGCSTWTFPCTSTLGTGAVYTPPDHGTEGWTSITSTNAPSSRMSSMTAWTGSEFIVWGGNASAGTLLNDGALYNPSTNVWTTMSNTSAPSARRNHVWEGGVWIDNKFMVWGGVTQESPLTTTDTGGLYQPYYPTW